jgi:type II secretory pathway pseudopilin PulG
MKPAMNRVTEGPRTARRRPPLGRAAEEAGFGLIEAIVAATVLAVLALGVLAGIDGASSATGREKARAVAGALAEQDQERMRGMRAVDLPEYRWTRDVPVDGIEYHIVSEADWVSDSTTSEVSCTNNGGKADFIRLRTTVTSPTVGAATEPVRIDSLLAPPIGSSGGNNGTLSVQVLDRDAAGIPQLPVSIAGTASGHAATKLTNAKGCAIFAYVPADTYTARLNVANHVDKEGVQAVSASSTVTTGNTTILPLLYDRKGSLTIGFTTQYVDRSAAAKPRKQVASRAWQVSLANGAMATNLGRRIFPATATAPQATITADGLFPFKDGYGVYAGRCADSAPSLFDATWAGTPGNVAKFVDRGSNGTMTVQQPALPVRVADGTWSTNPQKNQPKWIGGATVMAKLVVPATSACAGSPPTLNGMQSYPDGMTFSGTRSTTSNYDDGFLGFLTKTLPAGATWNAGFFDPGMPWGTWQVCADNGTRRNFVTVLNNKPDGTTGVAPLDVSGTGSQLGTCAGSTWPAASTTVVKP